MSSLSRDWVWMAVPKEEGGVGDTPYTPAPRIHLAKTPFSFRNPLNVLNAMAIFLWVAAAQTAVRVHQSIVPADAALCICDVSLSVQGEEKEQQERGSGVYHRLQSCLQLQLLFDNMCGFISFTCQRWIRGLFDYCAPRFHFLSARWLSASYHSRFRHSSSVDTKKVTTHTHAHSFTSMSARPRMMTNTCSEQKDSQAA